MREEFVLRLAVVAAVVVMVAAATASDAETWKERRMTPEERKAVMERLQRDHSSKVPPCIPPENPPSMPLPTLPHSFTTELELTHQEEDKQKVLYGAEAFDRKLNMGILRYELREGIVADRPYDKQEIIHYSLTKDEALIITTDTTCEDEGAGNCDPKKSCKAKTLDAIHVELWQLFGLGEADGNTGYYGISGILEWATQNTYEYSGRTSCRGIDCEKFDVCIKSKEGNTALITYYWPLTKWTIDGNDGQVPLAIEVISDGRVEPYFTRSVMQRYDFYEFYSNIRPSIDILEPPADVYCKGRVSQYEPPKMPRFFSYNSETVTPFTLSLPNGENQTHNVEFTVAFTHYGYYDWDSKISMIDFVPWYIFGQEYRYELETRRIQDFTQGLTYDVYKHLRVCDMHPIENFTNIGDVMVGENGTVSLLPPWLFVDLDEPWQYNGLHDARGLDADVWVGQKELLGFLLKENYVAYYASPLVFDEPIRSPLGTAQDTRGPGAMKGGAGEMPGAGQTRKKTARDYVSLDSVPMKLERYLNIAAGLPHLISNIFDYQTQPPFTHSIDISLCYKGARKRDFLMELPSDAMEQVKGLEDNLLHATQLALAEVGVVSPLRINKEVMEYRNGKTYVLFTILPLPSVVGDAPGAKLENDLDTAANLIVSTVASSKMIIIVHLEGIYQSVEPVYVILHAKSIREVTRAEDDTYTFTTDQGYGPGDMAGLAIGLLVVGVLVGVVVCMAWQRREGSQSGLPRVTMARKSPLSPSNTININSDMTASDI